MIDYAIDPATCIHCNACVRDCPMRVLEATTSIPAIRTGKEEACIHCQHCMAVCPVGAFSIDGKQPKNSLPRHGLDLPSSTQMENMIRARRSIRQYRSENVAPEVIRNLLATLANVPTGCNAQALTFTVVDDAAKMAELRDRTIETIAKTRMDHPIPRFLAIPAIAWRRSKIDEFFRGAPHLLIVSAGPRSTTPQEDAVAALAYFDLLAQSHGLGTTWCGYLRIITDLIPAVRDVFGIPRTAPYYAMLFGYPAVTYARTVQRDSAATIRYL